ncbi:MAG: radical SAM protein [Candidatus Sumerlaeia bacterium]|nr:radical SAM protein [Candidatus Sumerlaeia bacterium]
MHGPAYLALAASGELAQRAVEAWRKIERCDLCPRACGVNRSAGERGFCRAPARAVVASHNRHDGEEPPISGVRGSGTIFFTHCTMRCVYCQNFPISQGGVGREVGTEGLAEMMLDLQARGCHNVNFVTPTHFAHEILAALALAVEKGFRLPLVYNTSGFESLDTLRLLDGVIDIYLPDIRYADECLAERYSSGRGFVAANRAALREMWRQVGPLQVALVQFALSDSSDLSDTSESSGPPPPEIARRGLIVRHLVMPGGITGTRDCLEFLAREISPAVHLSLMSQYFPANRTAEFPEINRPITRREYAPLVRLAEQIGFSGWIQPL